MPGNERGGVLKQEVEKKAAVGTRGSTEIRIAQLVHYKRRDFASWKNRLPFPQTWYLKRGSFIGALVAKFSEASSFYRVRTSQPRTESCLQRLLRRCPNPAGVAAVRTSLRPDPSNTSQSTRFRAGVARRRQSLRDRAFFTSCGVPVDSA